jgi:hypothetical protein
VSKLTEAARGRACTVRLPGCDGGGDTTVAAHFRSQRLGAGMAIKPADLFIAFACDPCHSAIDGRRKIEGFTRDEMRHFHLMGVLETQKWLLDEGHIHIGKSK